MNLVEEIKNNLEWLDINIKNKTFKDVLNELENYRGKDESLAIETMLKIKLLIESEVL